MGKFYELRNFMNAWSQEEEEQELHESSANRLYECKPVKTYSKELRLCLCKCFWQYSNDLFMFLTSICGTGWP